MAWALVSVAQLTPKKPLRLVNCSEGHENRFGLYFEEPSPEIKEQAVWRAIARAFSELASPDPGVAEYAPTQVLAEHFKRRGYDGVFLKSNLGSGYNIAAFDIEALASRWS